MKYLFIIFFLIVMISCYGMTPSQQKLIDLQKKELLDLNKALLKNKTNLKELKNQDVYIRAKLVDKENGKYKIVISDISAKQPEKNNTEKTEEENEYLYIKGRLSSNNDNEYKLDIEYVLPPESDVSANNK